MEVGDMVTYGDWFIRNQKKPLPIGTIVDAKIDKLKERSPIQTISWFLVWWHDDGRHEWEENIELKLWHESR